MSGIVSPPSRCVDNFILRVFELTSHLAAIIKRWRKFESRTAPSLGMETMEVVDNCACVACYHSHCIGSNTVLVVPQGWLKRDDRTIGM